MVNNIPDEWSTTCRLKRKTASHLAILTKNLHFHSADELIALLIDIVVKKRFSKSDLESLSRYGKIIQVMSGTARNENEMLAALGIKKFKEKGLKIKGKVKENE